MFAKPLCETRKWHYATVMFAKPFCETRKWHYATVMFAKPLCETPKWHYATVMFASGELWEAMIQHPSCETVAGWLGEIGRE